MRENYAPWSIEISTFPEKGSFKDRLKFLIGLEIITL